jgi:hypothetical protein
MTQSEDPNRISPDAGLADKEINALVSDEHGRYEFYIKAFALAPPPDDRTLLCTVLRDPDRQWVRQQPLNLLSAASSTTCLLRGLSSVGRPFSGISQSQDFLSRRIQEWSEFKRMMDGVRVSLDSLGDMSNWLQRKLSDEVEPSETLAELIEFGRTRRIRDTAKQHRLTTFGSGAHRTTGGEASLAL